MGFPKSSLLARRIGSWLTRCLCTVWASYPFWIPYSLNPDGWQGTSDLRRHKDCGPQITSRQVGYRRPAGPAGALRSRSCCLPNTKPVCRAHAWSFSLLMAISTNVETYRDQGEALSYYYFNVWDLFVSVAVGEPWNLPSSKHLKLPCLVDVCHSSWLLSLHSFHHSPLPLPLFGSAVGYLVCAITAIQGGLYLFCMWARPWDEEFTMGVVMGASDEACGSWSWNENAFRICTVSILVGQGESPCFQTKLAVVKTIKV